MTTLPPISDPHDPAALVEWIWPHERLYDREWEIIYSVRDNKETYVPAANGVGKDWTSGLLTWLFWISPQSFFSDEYVAYVESLRRPGYDPHTRRIMTTSVTDSHLGTLWGEIGRFAWGAKVPLLVEKGGPYILLQRSYEIREAGDKDSGENPINWVKGRVTRTGDKVVGMAGHHAAYTLGLGDEASGIEDEVKEQFDGWTKKQLWISNCNGRIDDNFFGRAVKAGDLAA